MSMKRMVVIAQDRILGTYYTITEGRLGNTREYLELILAKGETPAKSPVIGVSYTEARAKRIVDSLNATRSN